MWQVGLRVIREDINGKIIRGLAVVLVDDKLEEYEVTRVAFQRSFSSQPDLDFETALDEALDKAEEAKDVIVEFEDEIERARADAVDGARQRILEILDHDKALQ